MSIGTLNESPLHAALKARYLAAGGRAEVALDGFVADVVQDGVVYEIQTGSFSGLQRKLLALAERGPLVLVHPIARRKTLVKLPEDEAGPSAATESRSEAGRPDGSREPVRRRSPRRGHLSHIVRELVYIPAVLRHPNFQLEVLLTEEEEVRAYDARKRRGRGGWRVLERRLIAVQDRLRLGTPTDLYDLLPAAPPEPFTTRDLATALRQPLAIGQKLAYCLHKGGVAEVCGKQGNAICYRAVAAE